MRFAEQSMPLLSLLYERMFHMSEILNVPEIFGSDAFNEATMRSRLPEQIFLAWKNCIATAAVRPLVLK